MARFNRGSILFILCAGGVHLLVFLCIGVFFAMGGFPAQDGPPWNQPLSDVLVLWVQVLGFPAMPVLHWTIHKHLDSQFLLLPLFITNSLLWGCAIWGLRKVFHRWSQRTRHHVTFAMRWAFIHAVSASYCLYRLGHSRRGLVEERIVCLPDLESMAYMLLLPFILVQKGGREMLRSHPFWFILNSLIWGCGVLALCIGFRWVRGKTKGKSAEESLD